MPIADQITARDISRQMPMMFKRLPFIMKGLYYYAVKKKTKPLTLGTLIERNADKYPDRPAVLYEDRRLTYSTFNAWANQYAHFFRAQGLKKGDTIAIFLENRPELLAVLAGAAKVGVACAMVNTSQKGRVLEHSINLVSPRMVVAGSEVLEALDGVRDSIPLDHAHGWLCLADQDTREDHGQVPDGYENLAEMVSAYSTSNPTLSDPPTLGDTVIYMFTSGTTGLPKAAPGSHVKFMKAYGGFGMISLAMTPDDVLYCSLPFYHATALIVCWGSVLAGGSSIVIKRRFSASKFWDDVRYYNATTFGYVGELCRYLLNQPPSPQDRNHSLRKMLGNGLRPSIWGEFKERFGIEQVSELYASSEGNIGFTNIFNLDKTVGMSTAPFALVRYKEGTKEPVRNEKGRLERVKDGEPGLLLGKITKKWAFEGYTQKEATEKAIVRGAFSKNDAWFNTGDLLRNIGCRHLQFVDRMGDTFRWKGENVSTTEVENVIDGFDGIAEAIVYGVEIPDTNGKAGMATVVPANSHFDLQAFHKYLNDNLPPYAVPVFVRVADAIEKTGTFKYKKTDLQKQAYQVQDNSDDLYGELPGEPGYQKLDAEKVAAIDEGKYRF
ncbi:MAG: long-chain-acyl-CoA synthetase [Halomonadaceae bacterium]|nr:MAG: long-chain-acyl-CoA synthetase [Halomonadaceae bacterium]